MEIASSVGQPQPTRRTLNQPDRQAILQRAQAAACGGAGKAQLSAAFDMLPSSATWTKNPIWVHRSMASFFLSEEK
jgi:hypothetical protein